MQIAFMILAHEHPLLLGRLLDRLAHPDTSVVLHVDAKADIAPFRRVTADRRRVSLVPDERRVAVHYCGFSMLRATLELLDQAYRAGAERFVLLSGVDYPVRPLPTILRELAVDRELIAIDRRCDPDGTGWFDEVAYGHFFSDNRLLGLRSGNARLVGLAERLGRKLPRRAYPLPIHYGPSWWCLTRAAVTEVLDFIAEQPRQLDWFRKARLPDEMFFQTILKQSSRAGRIAMDATRAGSTPFPPYRAATHYVNFDGPVSSSPNIIDLTHLEKIAASGALFARKVGVKQSVSALDEFDRLHHGIG